MTMQKSWVYTSGFVAGGVAGLMINTLMNGSSGYLDAKFAAVVGASLGWAAVHLYFWTKRP
jgi:hypothetical protein